MTMLRTSEDQDQQRAIAEILEVFGDGVVVFDRGWRFAYLNRAAEAHFGFRSEDAVGRVLWDLRSHAPASRLRHFLETAMATREAAEADLPSELLPGRWLRLRAYPLAKGLGVTFRDVTERRERLLREREQTERLEL